MRKAGAGAAAEPGLNPFRAGKRVRTPQPRAEEHHQENLVKDGPEERQPDAFEAINEHDGDQPHRAADVEHARGVRNAQEVPGQRLAAQEIGVHVLRATTGNPQPNQDDRQEIEDYDGKVNGL